MVEYGADGMNFHSCCVYILRRMAERIEADVPDSGDFPPVLELFPALGDKHIVGKYGLRTYKMPSDIVADPRKRYVEACAYVPSGAYKADMVFVSGTKEEILEILRDHDAPVRLNFLYGELLQLLEQG